MLDLFRRNDAIKYNSHTVNDRTADIGITTHGSDYYFAIFGAMGASAFIFVGLGMLKPRRDRVFHFITAAVVFVAAIAYYTMGANLGFVPIRVEFNRTAPRVKGRNREIFYVRYIDWFITTPLLLLDLLLTAGMPWPTILWVILMDEIMVVSGLIGAIVNSSYKWGYFGFGCAALFYIAYQLLWEARRHSILLGDDVYRCFLYCGTLTSVIWFLYPVAWGVSEGGNVIAPDSEAVFYGVLDFVAKPVFGGLLLWGHRNIDPARLGLAIRDYDDDPSVGGHAHGMQEKQRAIGAASNGHSNGQTNGATSGAATDAVANAPADGVATTGPAQTPSSPV